MDGGGARQAAQAPACAVLWQTPRGVGCWRRLLWVRFAVRVAGWGLAHQLQCRVDVLVDPETEQAVPFGGPAEGDGPATLSRVWPVHPPVGGLSWLSPYELQRLAPVALAEAKRQARQELHRMLRATAEVYRREVVRLERYFARRRAEVLARMGEELGWAEGWLQRQRHWAAVSSRAGGGATVAFARRVELLQQRWCKTQQELEAIERERRQALRELAARRRPVACLTPAGLAVVWVYEEGAGVG